MEKKSIFFISCEEAKHICDKSQYEEASFWEMIKLNVRLSWCRITRSYSKENNKLSVLIEKSEVKAMPEDKKKNLKQKFQEELQAYK